MYFLTIQFCKKIRTEFAVPVLISKRTRIGKMSALSLSGRKHGFSGVFCSSGEVLPGILLRSLPCTMDVSNPIPNPNPEAGWPLAELKSLLCEVRIVRKFVAALHHRGSVVT